MMEPIKVREPPVHSADRWDDLRQRLADVCQQHVAVLAVNQCVDCSSSLCQACTLFQGLLPLCKGCFERRQKAALQGLVTKVLLAVLTIGAASATWWYVRASYVPPFDYAESREQVIRGIAILRKEPCDRKAILDLTDAMLQAGDNRGALDRSNAFLATCGEYPRLRWTTYEGYKRLSEWDNAAAEATKLIEADVYNKDFRWWRGYVFEQKGDLERAAHDYRQAVLLEPRLIGIPINLANVEERLGRPCEAIFPLEQLLFYYPDAQDTDRIRMRLNDLYRNGACGSGRGTASIRFTPGAPVISTRVEINGRATGTFIVDTGASYVALGNAFAKELELLAPRASVLVSTAHGITSAQITSLDTVKVQNLTATRVEAVVLNDLGPGIDGLLGRSFLGRFKMVATEGILELSGPAP